MADKGESTRYDRSGRVHVKSFAEITSCHTINISACSRGDNEKGVATVPNSTDTINSKGTKRQRNEENGVSSCKKSHNVKYLQDSVPDVCQNFEVISKIGEGTFSSVYLAKVKDTAVSRVALKHLIPTSSTTRIENEIKCLKIMGGKANVIELTSCIRHKDHVILIMPYFPHDKFIDYLPHISLDEVRMYMHALFQALRNVHSHHVIHRDIKPSNFLYHRPSKRFRLVDFGLAQLEPGRNSGLKKPSLPMPPPDTYRRQVSKRTAARKLKSPSSAVDRLNGDIHRPSASSPSLPCVSRHEKNEICNECQTRKTQLASRAGTPGFRAPEVLLKCPNQTTAIDIWSAGVILLCLLSGHYPFFRAQDDQSAMAQIISLMGSKECTDVSFVLGKEMICEPSILPLDLKQLCCKLRSSLKSKESVGKPEKKLKQSNGASESDEMLQKQNSVSPKLSEDNVTNESWDCIPDSVFDLLRLCLDLNPTSRVTAHQALSHSFFTCMNNNIPL